MINAIHHVDEKKQIQIRIEKNESTLRLSVYNSGQVIPEYEQSQLWDVFYKVDKARSREYGGHGLGLSIVKLIADIHGAEVGVDNEMEGVTFYIAFPI
jgi:signal transduction histidine kinase